MTRRADLLLRHAPPVLLALFVAACAVPKEDFEACDPGLHELGRAGTVCP